LLAYCAFALLLDAASLCSALLCCKLFAATSFASALLALPCVAFLLLPAALPLLSCCLLQR
jgi:hypothetical protein